MQRGTERLRGNCRRRGVDHRLLRSGARSCVGTLLCTLLFSSCSELGAWDLIAKGIPKTDGAGGSGGTTPGSNTGSTVDPVCKRRMRIVLDALFPDPSITDFPLLVHLTAGNALYAECRADGLDVCFKSWQGAALPFEIDSWNYNGTSDIWVKVDKFEVDSKGNYCIYAYFDTDESNLADRSAPTKVWSNGYLGVWHGKSGASLHDSTGAHDGDASGYTAPSPAADGKIGSCLDFSGGSSGFSINGLPDFSSGDFTIEFWGRVASSAASTSLISKGDMILAVTSINQLSFTAAHDGTAWTFPISVSALGSTWSHIAVSWAATSQACKFYLNTDSPTQLSSSGSAGSSSDSSLPLVIGNKASKDNGAPVGLDEVRISSVVRTDAWMTLQNRAENGSYITFDSPEDAP